MNRSEVYATMIRSVGETIEARWEVIGKAASLTTAGRCQRGCRKAAECRSAA